MKTTDVDVVREGSGRLHFSALNARLAPKVDAVVQQVSADRRVDEAAQQPYYPALLKITDDLPASVPTQ
ncbi:hypothetical protein HFO09_15225 [Rhizobium laguerreae]|uniref:hypothetical protein n=1 Tax=Rhizobium laguerreae TaxID=1076926 RepID=UPI001C9016F3|nr:hypothetical protein [Rhizobium laguerreae]MBY3259598.1 hypothetical protein [Rhizobium laguerreae]MBY3284443.1 hypothetical protein [Rhizobium laguerreae]MBY3290414.1 hypothetical protein [Rhizobium laguerreae]